jgi:P4 family phage/plasmid primase-like protien
MNSLKSAPVAFTAIFSPKVAKRYEIEDDKLIKKPADTLKTGPFETVSVCSMAALQEYLQSLSPGSVLLAGINKDAKAGDIGFGPDCYQRKKITFRHSIFLPGILIVDGDDLLGLSIKSREEFIEAITELVGNVQFVVSPSASSGVHLLDQQPQFKGAHVFFFVESPANTARFLTILHKRSIALGYGRAFISASGVVLERSLVDLAMKTSCQPCFEGGAIVPDGVLQTREITLHNPDGALYLEVPELSADEETQYRENWSNLEQEARPEAERVKTAWIAKNIGTMVSRGVDRKKAEEQMTKLASSEQLNLPPDFIISTELFGEVTVRELLTDLAKYDKCDCRDPLDPDYGPKKAKFYGNIGGLPTIHSFAHGSHTYMLEDDRDLCGISDDFDPSTVSSSLFTDLTQGEETSEEESSSDTTLPTGSPPKPSPIPELRDIKNGIRFANDYRGRIVFVRDSGKAFRYSEQRGWVPISADEVTQLAKLVVSRMRQESAVAFQNEQPNAKELLAEVLRSSTERVLASMISMARTEPGMSVSMAELDTDPYLLGVTNGVVNLRTGTLEDPSSSLLVTKRANVAFDSNASGKTFEAFLHSVVPDAKEREFLICWLGYVLSGLVTEQYFLFIHGKGANGKSVLAEFIAWLLGDYALRIDTQMLMRQHRNSQAASPDIVNLAGRRLVYCSETTDGQRLDDARVKEMTGGDTLQGRELYARSPITFSSTHKLLMLGNHTPIVQDNSDGMWRRIKTLRFPSQFQPGDDGYDPDILAKLKADGPGALNVLLRGFAQFQKSGIQIPESMTRATQQYRDDQDLFGQWLEDNCAIDSSSTTSKEDLYRNYKWWSESCGVRPLSRQRFSRRLTERELKTMPDKRTVKGIELKTRSGLNSVLSSVA